MVCVSRSEGKLVEHGAHFGATMPRDESSIPVKSTCRRLRCVCAGNTRDNCEGSRCGARFFRGGRTAVPIQPVPRVQPAETPSTNWQSSSLSLSHGINPKLECPRRSPWIVSFVFVACRFEISQDYFYRSSNGRDDYHPTRAGGFFLRRVCEVVSSQ